MRLLFAVRKAALGSRHYLGALLKGLGGRGHTCQIMSGRGPAIGYLRSLSERNWWLPPLKRLARVQARHVLRRARPDVAHVMLCGATAPLIAECHEAGVPVVVTLLSGKNLSPFMAELEKVHAIIVLNRGIYDKYAATYPVLAGKLHLLGKLIDRETFHPSLEPPGDGYRVTYMGRLSRSKGELAVLVMQAVREVEASIPGVTLDVIGCGTRLLKCRARARKINRAAGRPVIRVLGGLREPEHVLRQSDLLLAAGYSAAEGLACGCQVIGLGMIGLYGLVTPEDLDDALAANFGDTTSRWRPATTDLLAAQIAAAYAARDESREWMEDVFRGVLDPERMLDGYEQVLREAAAG